MPEVQNLFIRPDVVEAWVLVALIYFDCDGGWAAEWDQDSLFLVGVKVREPGSQLLNTFFAAGGAEVPPSEWVVFAIDGQFIN